MNTLFDFVTHVKAIEYIIAVSAIAGFIIFWELLKPRPFRGMVEAGREDLDHIRQTGGFGNVAKTVGKVAAAPFVGLLYIVALPFTFVFALVFAALSGLTRALGISASFGWRPLEAYFTGHKKEKRDYEKEPKKKD